MGNKERVCPKCDRVNVEEANFCEICGAKISIICPSCWKNEGQPNSCPNKKCSE